MRYRQPELQERLASEYVLGTLQGRARQRFEHLLAEIPELADRVAAWQARLEPLDEELAPVTPPAEVWGGIEAHLGAAAPRRWRRLTLLATAATVVVALVSILLYRQLQQPQHLLVVTDEHAQPVWVVQASNEKRLKIKTLKSMAMPENKVCVLWFEWPDGHVQPVGVLSDDPGERVMSLPSMDRRDPMRATVAVSIEQGPRPPPQPRGEIVFRGRWIEL